MYLGAGASPQAWGQNKLWVLLAMVLEQSPQPAEHSHRETGSEGPACATPQRVAGVRGEAPNQRPSRKGTWSRCLQEKPAAEGRSIPFIRRFYPRECVSYSCFCSCDKTPRPKPFKEKGWSLQLQRGKNESVMAAWCPEQKAETLRHKHRAERAN